MSKIFEVELGRPGPIGAMTATSLSLPATPFELADALEKARITDNRIIYRTEMLDSSSSFLSKLIPASANLYELNHLAQRLDALTEHECNCFEGLVWMEADKNGTPIPVERLINFTHSLENCQIAYEAHNDKSLGKFYMDNDMTDIPGNLPESVYELLDYEAIGRKARMAEGGVFTERGYVVLNGHIAQVYKSGDAVPHEKLTYTIMLEICKGGFEAADYDKSRSEFPLLPAEDGIINHALAQLEAESPEDCSYRAADCIVPKLTEVISDSLYASDGDCYGLVNELAAQLKKLDEAGKLPVYRAMMEVAPDDLTLEDAIDLTNQVEWLRLLPDVCSPSDYAKRQLNLYQIECADTLFRNSNLYDYGQTLIKEKGLCLTEYGLLDTMSGQPVQEMLRCSGSDFSMEMR